MTTIDAKAKVRDIVVTQPQTRQVFELHGIDYCCGGGRGLGMAASEKGLNIDDLLEELRKAVKSRRSDGNEIQSDWSEVRLTDLADHIVSVHHTFMKKALPEIEQLLSKVMQAHSERHGKMLKTLCGIFTSLRTEIQSHLMKEEQILFPYIRKIEEYAAGQVEHLEDHCGTVQNPIRQMEDEHDRAGIALAEIRKVTSGFRLPTDACSTFHALYDELEHLERDLHEHIHLENNILFPRAVDLESAVATR